MNRRKQKLKRCLWLCRAYGSERNTASGSVEPTLRPVCLTGRKRLGEKF
jgi:hypothetical protein